VQATQIPRHVPPRPWWRRPLPACALAGLLPFCTCFVQALYLLSRVVLGHQWAHMWGLAALVAAVTALAAAEAAVVVVYVGLAGEDYRWWWPAFWAPASCGAYLLVALVALLWGQMGGMVLGSSGAAGAVVLAGHVLMAAAGVGLAAGAVGFCASLWFVQRLYEAAKAD
jgi:transmembrane 9 superfamily protein 2/4